MNRMLLSIYLSNTRNAMADLFKNTMNAIKEKSNIILIIPSAYDPSEFSGEFCEVVQENITTAKNKKEQIIRYYKIIKFVQNLQIKYKISHVFFENDMTRLCLLFNLFIKNVKFSFCLHDPILHEGTPFIGYCERLIFNIIFPRNCYKILLTYREAFDILEKNFFYKREKNKFRYLKLPQMPELEYSDLKQIHSEMEYDFIFFGRIEKYKGLDRLIKAFSSEKLNKIKLLIIGRGKDENKIHYLCEEQENITFINEYVDNYDLARYIKQSKCVILPYLTATGSQTVQIANYYGKLVLATKVGCFKEYISEGKNGFFINDFSLEALVDSIVKIYSLDLDRYKEYIEIEYRKFDIKDISERLYKEITG